MIASYNLCIQSKYTVVKLFFESLVFYFLEQLLKKLENLQKREEYVVCF